MKRHGIRWWPAIVILAVEVVLLAWVWSRDAESMQARVTPSFPILFFGTLLLFVWLVLFSRLAGKLRLAIFGALVLLGGLGALLLEIRAVDGNLVPILGFRWAPPREFDEPAALPEQVATLPGGADYPQFYGPDRRATIAGTTLDPDWRSSPPRELWRREVGHALGSFAVVGNAAVTFEQRGDDEVVVRHDLRTGRQVWTHAYHAPFNTTIGGRGPRSTPTIDGGRVFTLGASGDLSCLDLTTGAEIWARNVLTDHDTGRPDWGIASSPLVIGELVLVQLGREGVGLAAYDRATGEPAWRKGEDRGSYTSPMPGTLLGRPQVLVVYQKAVAAHDPRTGEVLWRHEWPLPGERITMPLVLGDDRVLVSAGYGVGSRMLRLTRDARGPSVELLWESRRLKSKFAPMVLLEGVVYGLDDGVLTALDPESGERLWKGGRYGHGQLILAGELLLIQAESGEVVLVEASPEAHRELARLPALSDRTWNPPALAGSLLLVRNDREAAAYELAELSVSPARASARAREAASPPVGRARGPWGESRPPSSTSDRARPRG